MQRQSSSLFLLIGLVACGSDAPAPDEVRARLTKDLVAIADGTNASRAGGASFPDTAQFALLQTALSQLSSKIPTQTFTDDMDVDLEGDFDGAKAAQWLNEHLFTDANHAGDGIYNVPASLACESDEGIDPDCAQAFAKIQLRIRVSENDDLLQFALQIGPDHDEPLEVGLSAKLLSLSVDLDEAEHAALALLPKLGEDIPNFKLDGKATAKLELVAPAAARITFDLDRTIWIRFADQGESLDGPTAFEFSSMASHVLDLGLDGAAHSMSLAIDLGSTKARIPGDLLDFDEQDGPAAIHLPGFTADITYADGQPLKIKELGLPGGFQLVVGSKEAIGIDLNPNDGHSFHGQIANGLLEVSPRVDLRTRTDHAPFGEEAPVYDVTRVLLEGGLRAHADDSVEVVGGTFSIETNPLSYGFSAVNGQCVRGTEAYDTARDAYYTQFAVGTCN